MSGTSALVSLVDILTLLEASNFIGRVISGGGWKARRRRLGGLGRGEFLNDITINSNSVELAKLGLKLEDVVVGSGKLVGLVGDFI